MSVTTAEVKTQKEFSSVNYRDYAVLSIQTQSREYSSEEPYMTPKINDGFGSGFILKTSISGNTEEQLFFVTNAHVIAESNSIRVRYANNSTTYQAKTLFVNHDCDLALLNVDDPSFWKQRKPFTLRDGYDANNIQETVYIMGFPAGGIECSTTKGIISRIEMQVYAHSGYYFPAIQVDASVNPGNSGGPAVLKENVIGVTVQKNTGLENTNMIIPVTILKNFLRQSLLKGTVSIGLPYPDFLISMQTLGNKFLRIGLGIEDGVEGVLITRDSEMCGLKKNDILTHVDDIPIDNKGKINYRGVLFSLSVLTSEKIFGEVWKLSIVRQGLKQTIECIPNKVRQDYVRNVMGHATRVPRFYVGSGMVFQVATTNDNCKEGLKPRTPLKEEIIYISKIIKCEMTDEYETYLNCVVININGTAPKNIQHLIELFEKNPESLHSIQVYQLHPKDIYTIILPNLEKDPTAKMEFLNSCGIFIDRPYNLPQPHKVVQCADPKLFEQDEPQQSMGSFVQFSKFKAVQEDEKDHSAKKQGLQVKV